MEGTMPKTGPELLDEAASETSLDELMRRDPAGMTSEEFEAVVTLNRKDRAMFIANEDKKSARRQGIAEPEEEEKKDD